MANNISSNYLLSYQKNLFPSKGESMGKNKQAEEKDPFARYKEDATVELSDDARAAYEKQIQAAVKSFVEENSGEKEKQAMPELSSKAQDFLGKLQEQYGDKYDFFVVDSEEDLQNFQGRGSHAYSVVFTKDELERMAGDEEYAKKVMDTVDSIVGKTKELEESGELGEGVSIKSVMISVGDDGNVKLFAQLEKMSAEQQERLEKAREKHAEEEKAAEDKAAREKEKPVPAKQVQIEADNIDDFWDKILHIDWANIQNPKKEDH